MIAKYNGQYFRTGLPKAEMVLQRYAPMEGFEEITVLGGLKYYQKIVPISDIQELFLEHLAVVYQGIVCNAEVHGDGKTATLTVEEELKSFIKGLGFVYDDEFHEYSLEVNLNDCEEFRVLKLYFYPKDKEENLKLSKEEWLELYRKYEINQILPSML